MKRLVPALLLSALLFCSCNKSITPTITLTPYSVSLPCTGGATATEVVCNCSWTAACELEGTTITPSSYNGDCLVSITVPATESKVSQSVPVTFTATSGESTTTKKFVITLQAKPYIEILNSATAIQVPSSANGKKINIESNAGWEYVAEPDNADLTVNPDKGTYSQEVTVSFPEAKVSTEKTYTLTFRLKDDNTVKAAVTFKQQGKTE